MNTFIDPCATYYVVIIITKSSYKFIASVDGKIVCMGLRFYMCLFLLTSSAIFPCSVSIVIIVYLGISEVGI